MEETLEGEDDVAIVTDLGLNPLSGIETNVSRKKSSLTEMEAVTTKIAKIQEDLSIQKLASPWLPPLALRIESPKEELTTKLAFPIGMMDEPEKQSQTPIA